VRRPDPARPLEVGMTFPTHGTIRPTSLGIRAPKETLYDKPGTFSVEARRLRRPSGYPA
jgi:hypothetical protein